MTVKRSKYHARVVRFEEQLENEKRFEARHTTSFGQDLVDYNVVAETKSKKVRFRVELHEHSTVIKVTDHEGQYKELQFATHPDRVVQALQMALRFVTECRELNPTFPIEYPAQTQ